MSMAIANYLIASCAIIATAISAGISQGLTNRAAFKAIDIQPAAHDDLRKLALLASAIIETAAILGVFIGFLLLIDTGSVTDIWYSNLAKIGVGLAIIGAGLSIGFVSSWPAQEACYSIARQPFEAQRIFTFTLIVLSIIQTPLVLALIVALFIKAQAANVATISDSLRLIGAGFAIGIGCIGPALGLGVFSRAACRGLGINRNASARILTFTFISQAIIESPVIFAMVCSLILLLSAPLTELAGYAMLAAGLTMGLGTFGPGLSSGRTAAAACTQITLNPDAYTELARTSIFAQGVIDTAAIYVLLISLMIVFFV